MERLDKLDTLKDILFSEQQSQILALEQKIAVLEETLNERHNLSDKVNPIIKERLNDFVIEIPQTLGPTITEALNEEIKNSQDNIIETLYPILGKMIKRYIQNEMRLFSEKISNKAKNSIFSWHTLKLKIKARFKGVNYKELLALEELQPIIEQIIVVEKGSGLIVSKFSATQNIESDMVAGMLTAIKSFAEDAFGKKNQDLQYIEYNTFHIHLQNFSSYYISVVISGNYTDTAKSNLEDKLLDFAQNVINKKDLSNTEKFSSKLINSFKNYTLSNL